MSEPKKPHDERASEDDATPERTEPVLRSKEEVARALGAAPSGGSRPAAGDEALREGGGLRLVNSGALAGRPKLQPVKALRKDEPAPPEADTAATEPLVPAGPRKATLPPRLGALRPEGFEAPPGPGGPGRQAQEVHVPAGVFLYGETRRPLEIPAFSVDVFPVTNADYEAFVQATGHRPPLYWPKGRCPEALRDHPVVGVDYYDAVAYAQWCGKDLPYEDEWERAARGTDGRVYPWGNDQELSGANTQRTGLRMTVPVDLHKANVSPDGCRDTVGNVWEMTHSPAPGGGVVVRGGSWYDFALYAKTFFRFASRPDARNGTIGFRCVRREAERPDAAREVPAEAVAAEIAARRGSQPPVDPSEWSVERRDLVIDAGRLRTYVAELRAEDILAPKRGVAVTLGAPPAAPPVPEPDRLHVAPPSPAARTPRAAPPPPPPPPAPPPALREEEPEPVQAPPPPEPVQVERIHVGSTDEEPVAAPAAAAPAAAAPPRPITRVSPPRSLPPTMWVLLVAGFLLLGGLLAVLVNQGGDEPSSSSAGNLGPAPPAPDRLAGLPDPAPDETFELAGRPPRTLDLVAPSAQARLLRGTWLLLFADTGSPEGQQTLRAAQGMHRRLASRGVQVAVVLPRAPYADADGRLAAADVLADRLRADSQESIWDGIPVLLDPFGPDGRTDLARRYCRPEEPVTAVLLHEGQRASWTSPPSGGLDEDALARIAHSALRLASPPR